MADFDLLPRLMVLPLSILSLTVHEWAHAWSAFRLGDDTAARQGRLTFNPAVHIDVLGTLILPIFIGFGWAKPVPVDPARFRREVSMAGGMALTSAAGPLANLVIAIASAAVLGLGLRLVPELFGRDSIMQGVILGQRVGSAYVIGLLPLNVGLAIFNLLPVPPLDGSRIAAWLLPHSLRDAWATLERLAPLALFGLLVYGGGIVAGPINSVTDWLLNLARLIYRA